MKNISVIIPAYKPDKKLIDTLFEKNPFVGIVMTEVKLLTVTHVKWNNVAYDIIYNGEPILRVKFGINNQSDYNASNIVMKNGKIVEFGSYEELINNNSTFKSLVELG